MYREVTAGVGAMKGLEFIERVSPDSLGAGLFLAIVVLVAVRISSSFFPENSEWEPCRPRFRKVKLIDGSSARRGLMRRKVDGRWQYRRMTPQEGAQTMDLRAL
jgi:hypothetical protein